MAYDSTTGNVSISIPSEVSAYNYTITNTYTGVFGSNFSFGTNLTINITAQVDEDDDYCLNSSSKFLCGLFIFLIIAA